MYSQDFGCSKKLSCTEKKGRNKYSSTRNSILWLTHKYITCTHLVTFKKQNISDVYEEEKKHDWRFGCVLFISYH